METVAVAKAYDLEVDEAVLDAHPYVPGETYAEVFPEHETGRLG